MSRPVPDMPKDLKKLKGTHKPPPAPPKFLIGPNGEVVHGVAPATRPSNCPSVPAPSNWSNPREPKGLIESRGFEAQDITNKDGFGNTIINADAKSTIAYSSVNGREVDSKSESKGDPSGGASSSAIRGPPPAFLGTSYSHKANHYKGPTGGPGFPKSAYTSIPRPFMPLQVQKNERDLLHNRKADGKIMGDYRKRYVEADNIPFMRHGDAPGAAWVDPDPAAQARAQFLQVLGPAPYGVGPGQPARDLDETWSAFWDDEAGAVYYYNQTTGEATWVPPF